MIDSENPSSDPAWSMTVESWNVIIALTYKIHNRVWEHVC